MPIFRPRTRVEILRQMIARVVSRSSLVGILRNSALYHVLASAADEDAEQYFQLANLRTLFSIDSATGSDLDERASEIQPSTIERAKSLFASSVTSFSRAGTSGTTAVPAGTIVAAQDSQGQIRYRTTVSASITPGNDIVLGVPIVALEAGARGNVVAGAIAQLVTRVPGIVSTSNTTTIGNGRDRESDADFRARLKLFVQSLSRGTPAAIRAYALNVQLADGSRVVFAKVVEPVLPNGRFSVYLDDGNGGLGNQFDNTSYAPGSPDTLLSPALGGELDLYTSARPVRDDGSFVLKINGTAKVRGTDYQLNVSNGQVELSAALSPGDIVTASYAFYTALIQETQRVIDGDPLDPIGHPGVRAAGVQALVLPAVPAWQTFSAHCIVADDFDPDTVIEAVQVAITAYINGLDIGAPVIVMALIDRVMQVDGMVDFQILELSGSFPATNQTMLSNQVARIVSADLSIT
jgi:uncharacterized phage protein gp47/JayE